MRFDFLNETWKFVRRKMRHADGLCCAEKRVVTVDSRLEGERELEIILHELAHASDWWKDEKFAEMYGRDAARLLWRLGYRRDASQSEVA